MRRWFGNMCRTSGRAIALGPRRMGLFTWWCIVDQRLSIWTTLIGPTVAIVMTLLVRPSFGLVYLLWIMSTRLIARSEEHTPELQSLMRISYAVFCFKKKN